MFLLGYEGYLNILNNLDLFQPLCLNSSRLRKFKSKAFWKSISIFVENILHPHPLISTTIDSEPLPTFWIRILIWHPHPLIQPLCINSSRFRKFLIAFAKQSILESSSNVAKTNWRHAAEWTGVQTPSKPIAPLPPYFNHCASAPLSSGNSWLLLRSKAFRKAIPNVAENIWRLFAP